MSGANRCASPGRIGSTPPLALLTAPRNYESIDAHTPEWLRTSPELPLCTHTHNTTVTRCDDTEKEQNQYCLYLIELLLASVAFSCGSLMLRNDRGCKLRASVEIMLSST